jgi:hypothetical protein
MSSATIRRGRDERTGDGANVKNKRLDTTGDDTVLAEQYISFMPGVQHDEGETADEPHNALDDHDETRRESDDDSDEA